MTDTILAMFSLELAINNVLGILEMFRTLNAWFNEGLRGLLQDKQSIPGGPPLFF